MAAIKKTIDSKYWQKCGERGSVYTVDENIDWCNCNGKEIRGSSKS